MRKFYHISGVFLGNGVTSAFSHVGGEYHYLRWYW